MATQSVYFWLFAGLLLKLGHLNTLSQVRDPVTRDTRSDNDGRLRRIATREGPSLEKMGDSACLGALVGPPGLIN